MRNSSVCVIDCRSLGEVNQGKINAKSWSHFPIDPLEYEKEISQLIKVSKKEIISKIGIGEIKTDQEIVIYCMKGIRSAQFGQVILGD